MPIARRRTPFDHWLSASETATIAQRTPDELRTTAPVDFTPVQQCPSENTYQCMRMDRCGHQDCCRKDGFGGIRPQRIFLGDGARPPRGLSIARPRARLSVLAPETFSANTRSAPAALSEACCGGRQCSRERVQRSCLPLHFEPNICTTETQSNQRLTFCAALLKFCTTTTLLLCKLLKLRAPPDRR